MAQIFETDYPSAAIVDWEKKKEKAPHGEPGHNGYRCILCAEQSPSRVAATDHSLDHWQTQQIDWQEQCDKLQIEFDEEVSSHFPEHKPQGCTSCPTPPEYPPKPTRPIDRAASQSKEFQQI